MLQAKQSDDSAYTEDSKDEEHEEEDLESNDYDSEESSKPTKKSVSKPSKPTTTKMKPKALPKKTQQTTTRYQSECSENDSLYSAIENKLTLRTSAKGITYNPSYLVQVLKSWVDGKDGILQLVKDSGGHGDVNYAKLASLIPSHLTARSKSKGELAAKFTDIWRCIRENNIIVVSTEPDGPALRTGPKRNKTAVIFRQLTAIMTLVESICCNEIDNELETEKIMKSEKISGESIALLCLLLFTQL